MRWSDSLIKQQPITGRMIKEDGSAVNIADFLVDGGGDISEETAANIFSYSNGTTFIDVPVGGLPILSIRAKTDGTMVVPLEVSIFSAGNAYFEIYINTTLTGASWASAGSGAAAEYDIAATTKTGGIRIAAGYVVMACGTTHMVGKDTLLGRLGLEFDTAVNVGDIITVFLTPFEGSAAASASVQWRTVTIT